MKRVLALLLLFLATPAAGREGFTLYIGLGGGIWNLDSRSLSSSLGEINRSGEGTLLTSTLSNGLALRFALAYTIRGYASVEAGITGHGWNLSGGGIGGSGEISLTAHFHPFELFLPERSFDATIFLGGGYSILGGGQPDNNNSRGLDGGMVECGFTGRYFLTPWFSLGGEVRFNIPFFKRWYVDWNKSEKYDLKTSPDANFVALLATVGFHFSPAK